MSNATTADPVCTTGTYGYLLVPPQLDLVSLSVEGAVELAFGGEIFGTSWMVRLLTRDHGAQGSWPSLRDGLRQQCAERLALVDHQMSPWIGTSDLSRYNRLEHGEWMDLPSPMREIVEHAIGLSAETGGAFDPFLGKATQLWGFGPVPVEEGLPDPASLVHLRDLRHRDALQWAGQRLQRRAGFELDLCGIAKGYAVDMLIDVLEQSPQVQSALVEIGGETRGFGVKADTMPWWVELEWPGAFGDGRTLVALHGWACASTGVDVRSFEHEGRRYSHSIDPATVEPSESDLRGVSVLDRHCWRADALATALFVMGLEAAKDFADRCDVPCLLLPANPQFQPVLSKSLEGWCVDG